MGIYRGISSCTRQIFAVSVGDMLTSFWVSETLRQTEINNINVVLLFADPNQKIVRLNITM